jgi:glycosyltransferase involved in cell wall biosynthesis
MADSGSTDRTVELAEGFGARVIQIPFEGFGNLRNRTVEVCSHEWIFSLDADERCTDEVRDEIKGVIADPDAQGCLLRAPSKLLFGPVDSPFRMVS